MMENIKKVLTVNRRREVEALLRERKEHDQNKKEIINTMKIHNNKIVVQIGANNGNDEFRDICRTSSPMKIVLVEPNLSLYEDIKKNYEGIDHVFIEHAAITTTEKDRVTLVIPRNRPELYNSGNFSLLPMDDWGNDFEEIQAPGLTFNRLCEKYGIQHIHYLQIDTEGYDAEIIKSIDFGRISIDIIKYEKWAFPPDVFSRHGDRAKDYGTAGMLQVKKLLIRQKYNLREEVCDIIAIKP
jgi:FkbM family methyltransferase